MAARNGEATHLARYRGIVGDARRTSKPMFVNGARAIRIVVNEIEAAGTAFSTEPWIQGKETR